MRSKEDLVWELTLMYLQKTPQLSLSPEELRTVFNMANLVAYEYIRWINGD
jgi:hypothetical protein